MITIASFSSRLPYVPYKGAAAAPYLPDDEAILFSTSDSMDRYRVFRAVEAYTDSYNSAMFAGEIIFDGYKEDDPITEFVRAQTRMCMVPADINKTARIKGTFAA